MERRVIFECRTGSHLFGTNTPASDEDFQGVFLPASRDLMGLGTCPTEFSMNEKTTAGERNGVGDVDRKYFSLQRFLTFAMQGQPGQLEMMFAPAAVVQQSDYYWQQILDRSSLIHSQKGVRPFLGFALAQAYKATIKGENLNKIRELIAVVSTVVAKDTRARLADVLKPDPATGTAAVGGIQVAYQMNEQGFALIEIAGRRFDPGILLRSFLDALVTLEARYGKRSEAAAANGLDFKSLSHAVRLISEAEEYLTTGKITLPRPDAGFLLAVKQGQIQRDWFAFLTGEIDRIERDVAPLSPLPEKPDYAGVEALCQNLLFDHLYRGAA